MKNSIFIQMANIGAEVGRALNWQKTNPERSRFAFIRSIELIDKSVDKSAGKPQLKELLYLKEILGDYFLGNNIYKSTPENLNSYFYPYNYAARLNF